MGTMGTTARVDQLDAFARIKALCPNITVSNHRVTSPETSAYNCVGWVLGDEQRWWEPTSSEQYFWPAERSEDYSIESYAEMFREEGFEVCEGPAVEPGFEKIALYVMDGEFMHVALQLPSGRWTSKLGGWEDIEHDTLEVLKGPDYGSPRQFMKREQAQPPLL